MLAQQWHQVQSEEKAWILSSFTAMFNEQIVLGLKKLLIKDVNYE